MRLDNMKSVALKFMSYAMWSRMVRLIAHLSLDPMAVGQMCRQLFFYRAFNTLSFNRVDGDYVEFGCYQARTFAMAYHESRRFRMPIKLWAFDSFCGMPKPKEECDIHPEWCQGDMSTPLNNFHKLCKLYGIPINAYNVVPGFYEETIENMLPTEKPTNICLAYIDCDMYSSTKNVLKFLLPRLKHGMIIAFDDYYCYTGTQISGERKAMLEYFNDKSPWNLLPYIQYGFGGMSFIVEDKQLCAGRF